MGQDRPGSPSEALPTLHARTKSARQVFVNPPLFRGDRHKSSSVALSFVRTVFVIDGTG